MNEQIEQPATVPQEQPLPPQRPIITLGIAKATFNKELTVLQYQEALDRFNAMTVTDATLADVQASIKKVRGFIKKVGDIKAKLKKPALDECDYWEAAYKSVLSPLETSLKAKESEAQKVADRLAAEARKQKMEKDRVDGIKAAIDKFILDTATVISTCKQTYEIGTVEKLIGSHKANKSRYQEFLPDLIARCNELSPLIKQQKKIIKELEDLADKKAEAMASGKDREAEQLQEQAELAKSKFDETRINIQETAIRQATTPEETMTLETVPAPVHFRRKQWKWEVQDIKALAKKMPHLVKTVPDEEKIDEWLKTKKTDGSLTDKEEELINGLRFYLEKLA